MSTPGTTIGLVNQLGLQQTLTPLQVQYAKMLAMSGPEVEEEVQRVLDDNPALEKMDEADGPDDFNETAQELQDNDFGHEDEIPGYRLAVRNSSPDDAPGFHQVANDVATLIEVLEEQLGELKLSRREKAIATFIIGNLDANGYLTRSVTAMADDLVFNENIEVTVDEVRRGLSVVRSLDPAGVGAVDLRDCLLLQLQRLGPDYAVATEIVRDYFDLFSNKHYDRLRSLMGVKVDTLKDAIEKIRSLNPKPGAQFGSSNEQGIIPDFLIENEDGRLTLSLVNNIPALCISRSFADDVDATTVDSQWVKQKRNEGNQFIQMLSQRQATLFAVMEAIMKHQREFFKSEDPVDLRPMILKDIATATGFDISVISRATAGKYVATPTAIYPLKMFFNERPKADDESLSVNKILTALKDVIDKEDSRKPLSDQAIMEAMNARGFDIARRTVAKYRERLGYPVARLRKKL